MKVFKILGFTFAMVLFAITAAQAIPLVGDMAVDFRSWSGANNQASWTVGPVTATPTGGNLYWDNTDGLGVNAGEADEIDHAEKLAVSFSGGMSLRGLWVTDLFAFSDGAGGMLGEQGQVVINGGAFTFAFDGKNSDQANGEQYIDFGGAIWVTSAEFLVLGGQSNNEFSVAGFVAAPEPITMLLLGFGLVGLAGVRRFKK